jgi:hypothetical protein
MSSSLSKFSPRAIVAGNRVFVSGSTSGLSMAQTDESVVFVSLSQRETLQQFRLFGPFDASSWNVGLPAEGFENGEAVAVGLVVTPVLPPPFGHPPGGYQTFTWANTVVIEGAPDAPEPAAPK